MSSNRIRCGSAVSWEEFERDWERDFTERARKAERLTQAQRRALMIALNTLLPDPDDVHLTIEEIFDSVTSALCLQVAGGARPLLARALLKKSSPAGEA